MRAPGRRVEAAGGQGLGGGWGWWVQAVVRAPGRRLEAAAGQG